MEELLKGLVGKSVDVNCGNASIFRGSVLGVEGGLLRLKDEDDRTFFIAVARIIAVSEAADPVARPGFIG